MYMECYQNVRRNYELKGVKEVPRKYLGTAL
jgi:hypothetical protein